MNSRWFLSAAVGLMMGCHPNDPADEARRFQQEYIALLQHAPSSPVPYEDRPAYAWDSLFFPYNADFRWTGTARSYPHRKIYHYTYGEGRTDSLPLWGELWLPHGKDTFRLLLFLIIQQNDSSLFLPFYDRTNGTETYGGGRYLELPYAEGPITVDFNYATHPYCAYSDRYSCMLPPSENQIPVAVRAGERLVGAQKKKGH